jgi:hypothetical protein
MKCFDQKGREVKGSLLLSSIVSPDHAVFRDEEHRLYMVHVKGDVAYLKNGAISRHKAFAVADNCIAGKPIQGSMSEAMNAMAVTMTAAIAEYEARLLELEALIKDK